MEPFFWILTGLILCLGLAGTVLPILPGQILVMLGAILHYFLLGKDNSPGMLGYTLMVILMVVAYALEWAASALGTKKFGGTKAGMGGAMVGGIVGLFFGIPGLILGPILGALLAELIIARRQWKESGKAATGAMVGILLGMVGKFGCTIAMIGVFYGSIILSATE